MKDSDAAAETPVVRKLGIVGAGLMGSGIAQVAAQNGIDVALYDAVPGAAERAAETAFTRAQERAKRDAETPQAGAKELGRITAADGPHRLADADALIEAVIEDVDVKRTVFEQLAALTGQQTLLATNTSAIPISAIAGTGMFADRVIGMHFFSPVPAMKLCEIVRGLHTSDQTVERAQALAAALGKRSIVVNRDSAGFVTSRLMSVLIHEASRIVDEGLATVEDVDSACVYAFGHRMGPLATADLTGVDVSYRAGKAIFEATGDPSYRPPQLLARMVAAGLLGRKSGRGFYSYDSDAR